MSDSDISISDSDSDVEVKSGQKHSDAKVVVGIMKPATTEVKKPSEKKSLKFSAVNDLYLMDKERKQFTKPSRLNKPKPKSNSVGENDGKIPQEDKVEIIVKGDEKDKNVDKENVSNSVEKKDNVVAIDVAVRKDETNVKDEDESEETEILYDPMTTAYWLIGSGCSILFSLFLSIYSLLTTGDTATHLTLILIMSAAAVSIYTKINSRRMVFSGLPSQKNDLEWLNIFSLYANDFRKIRNYCLVMIAVVLTIFGITLGSIIFNLKKDANIPTSGVFQSFQYLTKNGKAIFVLLFFQLACSLTCMYFAQDMADKMYRFYSFNADRNYFKNRRAIREEVSMSMKMNA